VLELVVEAHPVHMLEDVVAIGVDPNRAAAACTDRQVGGRIVAGHHASMTDSESEGARGVAGQQPDVPDREGGPPGPCLLPRAHDGAAAATAAPHRSPRLPEGYAQRIRTPNRMTRGTATTVFPVAWTVLDHQHLGMISSCSAWIVATMSRIPSQRPARSGQTARSVDGRAEPRGHLAEQLRLIFADPGHVAVRPQQHGGHVQFLAEVDDVIDPICPARHREPAGLVEQ
jgi:hypothetical protein